jgi:hypothetical protein
VQGVTPQHRCGQLGAEQARPLLTSRVVQGDDVGEDRAVRVTDVDLGQRLALDSTDERPA